MKTRFEAAYIKDENGNFKLIEISIVPNENGDIEIDSNTIMNVDLFIEAIKNYNKKIEEIK